MQHSKTLWALALLFLTACPASGYKKDAMRSEAKVNLKGLYVAEQSFFAEYNSFSTDLVGVHWFPSGDPRYLYGFCEAGGDPTLGDLMPEGLEFDSSRMTSAHPAVLGQGGYTATNTGSLGDPCQALKSAGVETRSFTAKGTDGFTAFAVGNLDKDADLDIWKVDESGALAQVHED